MKNWGTEFMNKDIAEVLITEEQIRQRVKELGEQISREYAGKEVVLLCVLKGACVFFTDLARAMSIHLKMDFMSISSYGDAQKTSGIVRINKDMPVSSANGSRRPCGSAPCSTSQSAGSARSRPTTAGSPSPTSSWWATASITRATIAICPTWACWTPRYTNSNNLSRD